VILLICETIIFHDQSFHIIVSSPFSVLINLRAAAPRRGTHLITRRFDPWKKQAIWM